MNTNRRWLISMACAAAVGCGATDDGYYEDYDSASEALCAAQKLTVSSATASSVETSAFPASYAIDAAAGTRWSSQYSDPQWIKLDLGATRYVSRVFLSWEWAASADFELQISNNGTSWTTLYRGAANASLYDDLTNLNATGRYLRIYSYSR